MAPRKPPAETVPSDTFMPDRERRVPPSSRLDALQSRVRADMNRVRSALEDIDTTLTEASNLAWESGSGASHADISRAQGSLGAAYAVIENLAMFTDW